MRRAAAQVTDKLYVEIYYPGIIVSETSRRPVKEKNPKAFAKKLDKNAFAFRYLTVTEAKVSGEGKAVLKEKYFPGKYLIGKKMTVADIEKLKPAESYRILLSNMKINGWDTVVQCRPGNFQDIGKYDVVIPPPEEKKTAKRKAKP